MANRLFDHIRKVNEEEKITKRATRGLTRGMLVNWDERCDNAIISMQRRIEKETGIRPLKHEAASALMNELLDLKECKNKEV